MIDFDAARAKITEGSHELFMELAEDAPNWSGIVPTDCNVQMTKEQRGNLTQLKVARLVETFQMDGSTWVQFTPSGVLYAAEHGITDLG